MITGFCSSNLHFVNCSLLFCVVLLLNHPLSFFMMYVVFLNGLEPWSI
jgi:hypothetical protein